LGKIVKIEREIFISSFVHFEDKKRKTQNVFQNNKTTKLKKTQDLSGKQNEVSALVTQTDWLSSFTPPSSFSKI